MSTNVADWEDVEAAARELAGNHRHFSSFGWSARPDDDEDWALVYTNNRNSRLLEESNAEAIEAIMRPFLDGEPAPLTATTIAAFSWEVETKLTLKAINQGRVVMACGDYEVRFYENALYRAIDGRIERCEDFERLEPDIVAERHNHWAVGWVDGYALRVYQRPKPGDKPGDFSRHHTCLDCKHEWDREVALGRYSGISGEVSQRCPKCQSRTIKSSPAYRITNAFRVWCGIGERLADYPVLDEEAYSNAEYEATLENIAQAGRRFVRDDAPQEWPSLCFSWFWDNDQSAVENSDDQGGYPSDEEMATCLCALGFVDWYEYDPALLEDYDTITAGKFLHETGDETFYFFRRGIYMVKWENEEPKAIHQCGG